MDSRVAGFGRVRPSSSTVLSSRIMGGVSPGLRKWLISSNYYTSASTFVVCASTSSAVTYSFVEPFARRGICDEAELVNIIDIVLDSHHLHHPPACLRWPKDIAYIAGKEESQAVCPQMDWSKERMDERTILVCNIIFFTTCVDPEIRKSMPC